MNRAAITTAAAVTAVLLAGCSTATSTPKAAPSGPSSAGSPAAAAGPSKTSADAASAFTKISAAVPSAKLGGTVTAESDGNHLLGRPHQYTSKINFTDSRVSATDTDGLQDDDLQRGGSIETFTTPDDAKTRHDYLQAVTKGIPAFAEYDYLHGTTLIRVSHLLTPAQAAGYEKAAAKLP